MLGAGVGLPQLSLWNRKGRPALDLFFAEKGRTTLDPRITFSRTTNATVTGSNGLIQNAPMNLLTFSEQFDNAAWTKSGVTVTANTAVAPDGASTADKYVESALNEVHSLSSISITSSVGLTYVLSVYAKNAGRFLRLILPAGTFGNAVSANFDLVNGIAYDTAGTGAVIQSVGNGWYRCSIKVTATSGASGVISVSSATTSSGTGSYAGDGTSGVYLWGAQLELGSTATAYNPTTVKNLLGYTEHFDNAAWTKSNAFVQTNLVLQSEALDTASWVKSPSDAATFQGTGLQAVITANYGVDINGNTTADRVQLNCNGGTTSSDRSGFNQAFTVTAGIPYTSSFYVKPLDSTTDSQILNSSLGILAAGSSPTSSTITDAGNGWKRVVRVYTPASSVATLRFQIVGSTGPLTFDGLIWGAQLVQGASAGDYKATYAAAAPVGYTDIYGQPFAQKLVEDTATNAHFLFQSLTTSGTYTASLYAKSAERSTVAIRFYIATANWVTAVFDLATGVVSQSSAGASSTFTGVSPSIQSVGNGWYRCALTATGTSVINTVISTTSSATPTLLANGGVESYTGNGTSGIYIFGARLSDSASVDPYVYNPVAAPTSTAYYGPRFDYDPVTLAPKGLLIEEQRTNLVLRSEEFGNASWTKTESSVTANAAVSPDGAATADKLIASTAATTHLTTQAPTAVSGTTYTFSVHLKAAEYGAALVGFVGGSGFGTTSAIVVNLATGAISAGTGTLLSSSAVSTGNGWWRVAVSLAASASAAGPVYVAVINGTTFADRLNAGNGTSGIYLWGAQLEAGAFATSYIPTVASQVTRAADSASMIGNNFARWYTQGVGSLFSQHIRTSTSGTARGVWALNDGTTTTAIDYRPNGGDNVVQISGATQADIYPGGGSVDSVVKNVLSFAVNNFSATTNAGTTPTDTSGNVPVVSQMVIGGLSTSTGQMLCGNIQRIAFYSRVLSSAEQKGITA